MVYEDIILEKAGNVATLTLNRPKALNAMSIKSLNEIRDVITTLKNDDSVKVVILTSAGERAFSTGTDLKNPPTDDGRFLHETLTDFRHFLKPVVCAVKGYCLGSGLDLALCCDYIIGAENSQFGMPEINVGVVSNVEGGIMSRAMSIFRAKEMVMLGEFFNAQKAEKCGLINEVVPLDKIMARATEIALKFASKDATALRYQKDIVNKWMTSDLETAMDYSILAHAMCHNKFQGEKPKETK